MIAGRRESYRNHGSRTELAKLTMLRGRTPETQSPSGKLHLRLLLWGNPRSHSREVPGMLRRAEPLVQQMPARTQTKGLRGVG